MMSWVDTIPMPVVRAIGVLELLGAIGLILPPLTGIAPGLSLDAAIGYVVLQVCATGLHLSRGEKQVVLAAAAMPVPSGSEAGRSPPPRWCQHRRCFFTRDGAQPLSRTKPHHQASLVPARTMRLE